MDRITGNEVRTMMEAYSSVYTSTLTEEVINSTAEQWVAACIEEGINFEEYTLDEITEAFIADCEQPEVLNEFFGMQGAQNFGADMRQRFGQARRAVGAGLQKFGAGVKDVVGATAQGVVGQRTTSQNPLARMGNAISRGVTAPQRAGAALVGGFLTGRRAGSDTAPATPSQNAVANKAAPAATAVQKPPTAKEKAYGPRSTLNKDQQAVNREYDRLRKSDPEAAAAYGKKMAAAGAANKNFSIPKPTQAQSAPTQAQKQARVDASIKSVNTPEKMNRQAPAGTALRAQQDKQAAAKAAANAPRRQAAPGARNAQRAPGGIASGRPVPPAAPAGSTAVGSAAAAKAPVRARPTGERPMGARNRMREELDIFDTIKEHLISEHELSEDVAIQVMTLLDEETRGEIMEYTASMGGSEKKTTVRMTADGKEPAGDRLLRGIRDRVGGFLQKLNPKALKSTQKNSYELEGELVDEGSCGSKKKRPSKKKGY